MKNSDLIQFQRRLRECPEVYGVMITRRDTETSGRLYGSREAAEHEARWWRARGNKAEVVLLGHLMGMELARSWWGDGSGQASPPQPATSPREVSNAEKTR